MKYFNPALFSKNMQYCCFVREKPDTTIYKINFNVWCVVWHYKGNYSIQIINPKKDTREPIDFKWTEEQVVSILKRLLRKEAIQGQFGVIKSINRI